MTARDSSDVVASSPSPTPPARPAPPASTPRIVDTDENGRVKVTAELRGIAEIHSDIQRLLGPGASDPLTGLARARVRLDGDDLSWFFRFDDAEARVSIHPSPGGCAPSGEEIENQTGCLATGTGVEYLTAGPWARDGKGLWGQTVVSWQRGFEIMVVSTNVHEEVVSRDGAPSVGTRRSLALALSSSTSPGGSSSVLVVPERAR